MCNSSRNRMGSVLARATLFAGLWAGLVGVAVEGLVLGLAVVPAAVALSLRLMPVERPLRPGRLFGLLPGFHARSVLGGLDVAARAMAPRMPLAPGWVVAPVGLPPGGRVAMGASLSLMPGTLAAGSDGDRLLVHVLDATADHRAALHAEERRLARLYRPRVDAGAGSAAAGRDPAGPPVTGTS